jgi:glutaredoxin 3
MTKKWIIYTTPICPECERVKRFFKEKGIPFKEVDLFENKKKAEEIFKKTGQKRVPITEINKKLILGFDKNLLKKI